MRRPDVAHCVNNWMVPRLPPTPWSARFPAFLMVWCSFYDSPLLTPSIQVNRNCYMRFLAPKIQTNWKCDVFFKLPMTLTQSKFFLLNMFRLFLRLYTRQNSLTLEQSNVLVFSVFRRVHTSLMHPSGHQQKSRR